VLPAKLERAQPSPALLQPLHSSEYWFNVVMIFRFVIMPSEKRNFVFVPALRRSVRVFCSGQEIFALAVPGRHSGGWVNFYGISSCVRPHVDDSANKQKRRPLGIALVPFGETRLLPLRLF